MTRVVTGTVGAAVILGGVYWSVWSFFILFFGISFFTLFEFYNLIKNKSCRPLTVYGILFGLSIYTGIFLVQQNSIEIRFLWAVLPFIILPFIIKLYAKNDDRPFINGAFTSIGVIYALLPFALLPVLAITNGEYDYRPVLGIIFLLWANDTFAYLTGKLLGRHKLFERLSPNKTWEGAIGGGAAAVVTGYFLFIGFDNFPLWKWLAMAVIVSVAGTFGDLAESSLKRSTGAKDSGNLLPGHGGFLDRFDGFLFAVPAVIVFLKLFN